MKFILQINQKEVMNSGITGVDAIDMLVFDVASNAILCGNLDDPEVIDGKSFQWVSYNLLINELPLLNLSKAAMKRRVANLVAAGLLIKSSANEDQRKLFMAIGPAAKRLNSDYNDRFTNEQGGGFTNEQTLGSQMSSNKNTNNKKTNKKENTPTPFVEVPSETSTAPSQDSEKTRAPRVKKRITYKEAKEFYDGQLKNLFPLPESVAPGGDEWKRREGYRRMIEWMTNGDDETPETMQSTVMAMPSQLTYVQLCKLLERNLTWYQIKHYIKRLHGYTELKSRGMYDTIVNWHNGDVAKNSVPPANPGKTPTGDASMKATKPTNQTYNH